MIRLGLSRVNDLPQLNQDDEPTKRMLSAELEDAIRLCKRASNRAMKVAKVCK